MTTTVHKFQEKGTPPPKKPRKAILLEELPDNTNIQLAKNEKGLFVDESGFIHVYTDGACSKNGQLGKMVKKSFVSFYLRFLFLKLDRLFVNKLVLSATSDKLVITKLNNAV